MNTYTKHFRPLGKVWTLPLASLCLLASCQSNKIGEDFESCHVQGINISKEPHQVLRYHVNLGNMPPFAPYVNKVVTFKSPCAIQVYHHFEGLIWAAQFFFCKMSVIRAWKRLPVDLHSEVWIGLRSRCA